MALRSMENVNNQLHYFPLIISGLQSDGVPWWCSDRWIMVAPQGWCHWWTLSGLQCSVFQTSLQALHAWCLRWSQLEGWSPSLTQRSPGPVFHLSASQREPDQEENNLLYYPKHNHSRFSIQQQDHPVPQVYLLRVNVIHLLDPLFSTQSSKQGVRKQWAAACM